VHIGVPGRTPSEWFDFVVAVAPQDTSRLRCPFVTLDMRPTPVLLSDLEQRKARAAELAKGHARPWAVLVGGDGAGYRYRPDEWRVLAGAVERLRGAHGAGILLTTSRRTGGAAEAALKEHGPSGDGLLDATWYSEAPRDVVLDYLAAAELVFCTEDSRSMISDAIAAGKPVYTIRPDKAGSEPRQTEFLAAQEAARRIKRVRLADLASIDVADDLDAYFRPLTECWSVKLLSALRTALPDLTRRLGASSRP
jgi:mitochondrial fission protein ELM1